MHAWGNYFLYLRNNIQSNVLWLSQIWNQYWRPILVSLVVRSSTFLCSENKGCYSYEIITLDVIWILIWECSFFYLLIPLFNLYCVVLIYTRKITQKIIISNFLFEFCKIDHMTSHETRVFWKQAWVQQQQI